MSEDYFMQGFEDSRECFAPGNPYLPTSAAHMLFEAGRYARNAWRAGEIKAARPSRGSSVRVILADKSSAILRIDYDAKTVSRAS